VTFGTGGASGAFVGHEDLVARFEDPLTLFGGSLAFDGRANADRRSQTPMTIADKLRRTSSQSFWTMMTRIESFASWIADSSFGWRASELLICWSILDLKKR
jgi:hypothetical protein